jgi:Ni/Co efflux regulator RcnB
MDRSPIYNFTAAPGFDAPKFNAPNSSTAWDDPGYQFRLKSGSDALQRSAAARGTLRTGGTLKDIMDYGQNFASQEYGNIYNRALQNYNTEYQGAKDTYAPKFSDWQMGQNAELSRGNQAFARQWDLYALANNLQMSKDSLAGQLLSTPPA